MMKCQRCQGRLIMLETYCTDPYQQSIEWYRDIKQRCVCAKCGLEQNVIIDTVKQPEISK